ncbi:Gypsy retrotransposon integrase-like protein 1, partial [Mucuna pruriens]
MADSTEAEIGGRWLLSVDRASNQEGSDAGIILEGLNGVLIEQSLHFEFKNNNNQAEYEALLVEMRLAKELEAKVLTTKSDSKLMNGQVNGEYQAKDPQLVKYLDRTTKLAAAFEKFTLHHVAREKNERVDLFQSSPPPRKEKCRSQSFMRDRSTNYGGARSGLHRGTDNMDESPDGAARYIIIGGEMYKRGFSFPLLRCIKGKKAHYVIKEVHGGLCGSHIGGQALASKNARAGYYWLTLKEDCMDYVRRCDKCQRFIEVGNAPPKQLHAITSPWPFHKWGVDILGPFPPTLGQVKYLIVVVDYFTKWIEAEPVAMISAERIKRFY